MVEKLHKIESFIAKHHVLSLATCGEDGVSACSLFYCYDEITRSFIVASSTETHHMQQIRHNNRVAGNIVLETKEVGRIEGLQFRGVFLPDPSEQQKKAYFLKYPYALAMRPTLWRIEVDFFKLTDNKLGFGKKIIWTLE